MPRQFRKIRYHDGRVGRVSWPKWCYANSDPKRRYGWCNPVTGDISVATDCSLYEQADTVIHEILHVLLRPLTISGKTEHEIIEAISPNLVTILSLNPSLRAWLLEALASDPIKEPKS